MRKSFTLLAKILMFNFFISTSAYAVTPAAGVRISADGKFGGGYSIKNNNQCFIVTAKHVVVPEDDFEPRAQISVIDRSGVVKIAIHIQSSNAPIKETKDESKDYDLALYKLQDPNGFNCSGQWDDGNSARSTAENSEKVFLLVTSEQGNQQRIYLDYVSNNGDLSFKFFPSHKTLRPQSGHSGSPIFGDGNRIIGIAGSIDPNSEDLIVIGQKTIDSLFSAKVVSQKVARFLISQVTYGGRGENRRATLSTLDILEGYGVVPFERDPYFAGTRSWHGNIDPRKLRNGQSISIPRSDYYMEVDVVSLEANTTRVKKYKQDSANAVTDQLSQALGSALIGGLFGKEQAEKSSTNAKRDRDRRLNETIRVTDVSIDIEFRVINTATGEQTRHRETRSGRLNTEDRREAEGIAIRNALQTGLRATLTKAGL